MSGIINKETTSRQIWTYLIDKNGEPNYYYLKAIKDKNGALRDKNGQKK